MNYSDLRFLAILLIVMFSCLTQAMEDQAYVARVDWEQDTQETTLMQQLADNLQLKLVVGEYDSNSAMPGPDSVNREMDMPTTCPTQLPDGVTDYQWLDREVASQPVQNIIDASVKDVFQKKYSPLPPQMQAVLYGIDRKASNAQDEIRNSKNEIPHLYHEREQVIEKGFDTLDEVNTDVALWENDFETICNEYKVPEEGRHIIRNESFEKVSDYCVRQSNLPLHAIIALRKIRVQIILSKTMIERIESDVIYSMMANHNGAPISRLKAKKEDLSRENERHEETKNFCDKQATFWENQAQYNGKGKSGFRDEHGRWLSKAEVYEHNARASYLEYIAACKKIARNNLQIKAIEHMVNFGELFASRTLSFSDIARFPVWHQWEEMQAGHDQRLFDAMRYIKSHPTSNPIEIVSRGVYLGLLSVANELWHPVRLAKGVALDAYHLGKVIVATTDVAMHGCMCILQAISEAGMSTVGLDYDSLGKQSVEEFTKSIEHFCEATKAEGEMAADVYNAIKPIVKLLWTMAEAHNAYVNGDHETANRLVTEAHKSFSGMVEAYEPGTAEFMIAEVVKGAVLLKIKPTPEKIIRFGLKGLKYVDLKKTYLSHPLGAQIISVINHRKDFNWYNQFRTMQKRHKAIKRVYKGCKSGAANTEKLGLLVVDRSYSAQRNPSGSSSEKQGFVYGLPKDLTEQQAKEMFKDVRTTLYEERLHGNTQPSTDHEPAHSGRLIDCLNRLFQLLPVQASTSTHF